MKLLELNGVVLKQIGTKSKEAKLISTELAGRTRMRSEVNLQRLKKLLGKTEIISSPEYMAYWKNLEEMDLGKIYYDRIGKPKMFNFSYDLRAIGKACIDGTMGSAVPTSGHVLRRRVTNRVSKIKSSITNHRPFRLSIEIPSDITESRVSKLLQALKNI